MSYFKSLEPINNLKKFAPYILDQITASRDFIGTNGLPNRKSEDWKYTSLRLVDEVDFSDFKKTEVSPAIISRKDAQLILTDEGLKSLTQGVKLFDWLNYPEIKSVESVIRSHGQNSSFLNHLNSAALSSVSLLKVAEPLKLKLLDLSNSSGSAKSHFVFIEVDKNSKLDLSIETSSQSSSMKNLRLFFLLQEGAMVNLDRFSICESETLVFSKLDVHLSDSSTFRLFDFIGGTKLNRNEILVKINGENATANLSCLYVGAQNHHIDNHVSVLHEAPNSQSRQEYRGILKDQARAVFNGKVKVERVAQKTNASQLNKTLMLSSEAEIDAKPQLEIDADDVKCGHGAAIAQINQDELFYLISRGIAAETSRSMLIRAFANEIMHQCHSKESEAMLSTYLSEQDFS